MGKGSGAGKGAYVADAQQTIGASYSSTMSKRTTVATPKGLANVGNTCYANAALQCLLSTSLSHALLEPETLSILRGYASNTDLLAIGSGSVDSQEENDEHHKLDKMTRREKRRKKREVRKMHEKSDWLTEKLTLITIQYTDPEEDPETTSWFCNNKPTIVDPSSITKHPDRLSECLRPYQQEDAHEFMRALLSTLTMNGHNKQLSSLFDGLLESAVTCQVCGRPSMTRDRYMDLSLDICADHVNTLGDALCEFTKTELLDEDNKVMCHTCEKKNPVTKGLRLATAPSILVFQLKRFAYDKYGRMVRLSKHVNFPLRLEIGEYMSRMNKAKPPPYELVAVLVHQGKSCDSGHYLAYIKCNNEWYKANDSLVTKVDVEVVLSQQAYMLMYEVAGMKSSTNNMIKRSVHNSWKHEDIHDAPHFEGSRAPTPDRVPSSIMNLLCGISEANDAILRDFCCGISPTQNRQDRGHNQTNNHPRTRSPTRTIYDIADPDDTTRGRRRRQRDFDCDVTLGDSTVGDASCYTTDSSQLSGFRRSNSGGNLREYENEASKVYAYTNSRPRTHSLTNSDPGTKDRCSSVKHHVVRQPRVYYPQHKSCEPAVLTRPPRPAHRIHRRHHSSTQKLEI